MWNRILAFFRGLVAQGAAGGKRKRVPVVERVAVHAIIIIGFLLAVWAASSVFEIRGQKFAEGWRDSLDPITCTKDSSMKELPPSVAANVQENPPTPTGTTAPSSVAGATAPSDAAGKTKPQGPPAPTPQTSQEESRVEGQFHQIQQRLRHHFNQLITYYSYSFATTIMVGILAAIAAIALVFITLDGWCPSSEYKKTIFLLATVTATYSAAFPSVFQLQKNIDDNRYLYLKYVELANEICSYQSTAETSDKSPVGLNVFIHQVDNELSSLNKIAVGTEASQIPDFNEALSKALGQKGTGTVTGGQQRQTATPKQKSRQAGSQP